MLFEGYKKYYSTPIPAICLQVITRALLAYRSWPMSELLVALLLIARRSRAISGWTASDILEERPTINSCYLKS